MGVTRLKDAGPPAPLRVQPSRHPNLSDAPHTQAGLSRPRCGGAGARQGAASPPAMRAKRGQVAPSDLPHVRQPHQSGPAYWIADLMPRDESRVGPGGDLRCHEADNPDVQWIMTAHFDSLSMQFIRNGERSTVRLSKTDEPVCLSRVRPHPDWADRG